MTPTLDELKLDLDELKHLAEISTTPTNEARLKKYVDEVSAEIRGLEVQYNVLLRRLSL